MSPLHLTPYATPIRLPQYCYFKIDSPTDIDCDHYKLALLKKGIAVISLEFPDQSAETMNNIVSKIGQVHEHDSQG